MAPTSASKIPLHKFQSTPFPAKIQSLSPLLPPFHFSLHTSRFQGKIEMKGSSSLIMGAVMVMVVSLAIVLGLVLVLLAELYCSLLLGRRQNRKRAVGGGGGIEAVEHPPHASSPSLSSFYAQGVLRAPRNFLFPSVSGGDTTAGDLEKQLPESLDSTTFRSPTAGTRIRDYEDQLIYICNPIYDNEGINLMGKRDDADTPFETPDSSPSRLETGGSPGSSNNSAISPSSPVVDTPPLTPMKRLDVPADTASLCLRDARSICTTGSGSNSNNHGVSSSSSGSTRTSPSW